MAKLWQKEYTLNSLLEQFTVGEDYLLDQRLVNADCAASTAHAVMLASIGILKPAELNSLKQGLANIIDLNNRESFKITLEQEDCHTAIENHLTQELGGAGKKIHTGRSRNDQVIAALRLYAKAYLIELFKAALDCIAGLTDLAEQNRRVPMPGRTHMQLAMPSSVGLWAAAFAEELFDDLKPLLTGYTLNDMSPLGAAASYGVALPLDRALTARLLGFKKVQNNVLYVNNSRGKFESIIIGALEQLTQTYSKIAQDLILFTLPELAYFRLPDELCSGSSIMPQKKNPDGLELIRAKSALVAGYSSQVKGIIRSLPSGYNRDFQETKGPFLKSLDISLLATRVISLTIERLEVRQENLVKAFKPEIYATDYAYNMVKEGMPFREAYRKAAANPEALKAADPNSMLSAKQYPGTTGNLNLNPLKEETKQFKSLITKEDRAFDKALTDLMGFKVRLI